jgi:hypothetical protein
LCYPNARFKLLVINKFTGKNKGVILNSKKKNFWAGIALWFEILAEVFILLIALILLFIFILYEERHNIGKRIWLWFVLKALSFVFRTLVIGLSVWGSMWLFHIGETSHNSVVTWVLRLAILNILAFNLYIIGAWIKDSGLWATLKSAFKSKTSQLSGNEE